MAVDSYRRIYTTAEVSEDDNNLGSIYVEEIYIWNPTPSLFRAEKPANSLPTINFTITSAYESSSPTKLRILPSEFYSGAAIKQFDDRWFKVDLTAADDDNFTIVDLKYTYQTTGTSPQSIPGRCFMAVGFHKLQIWTDIIPANMGDSRSAASVYNLYMDPMNHPGNARLKLRRSTTRSASDVPRKEGHKEIPHSISVNKEIASGVVYHRAWIKPGL